MNERITANKNRSRRYMAEYIARHEPLSGEDLRSALGWRMQQFFDAVYAWPDRWFVLTISGWQLTDLGREGLAASHRESQSHTPLMRDAIAHAGKIELDLDAWLAEYSSSR